MQNNMTEMFLLGFFAVASLVLPFLPAMILSRRRLSLLLNRENDLFSVRRRYQLQRTLEWDSEFYKNFRVIKKTGCEATVTRFSPDAVESIGGQISAATSVGLHVSSVLTGSIDNIVVETFDSNWIYTVDNGGKREYNSEEYTFFTLIGQNDAALPNLRITRKKSCIQTIRSFWIGGAPMYDLKKIFYIKPNKPVSVESFPAFYSVENRMGGRCTHKIPEQVKAELLLLRDYEPELEIAGNTLLMTRKNYAEIEDYSVFIDSMIRIYFALQGH